MQLCFFDDSGVQLLQPLTLTRPASDLRLGACTIQEKWEHDLGLQSSFVYTSSHLSPLFNPGSPVESKKQLWINSRLLPDVDLVSLLKDSGANRLFTYEGSIIAACLDAEHSVFVSKHGLDRENMGDLKVERVTDCRMIRNLWDSFELNRQELSNDLNRLEVKSTGTFTHTPVYAASTPEHIYIGKEVKIEHGAVLIADEGPIVIQDGARIMAGAIVRGPVSIGSKSTIKMGAKIYGNCSIGPHCKVGGEVTDSIFHSYSNKGHDGFVGHSLIGQWVNIGADTNTSNLKNNYSPVKIIDWSSGKNTATGKQFFGSVLGDHTKTAINTMLNTGTVTGVSCNIVSDTFPPKWIPNFAWFSKGNIIKYNFDKATDAMKAMMERRDIELSEDYITMMRKLHAQD